MRRAAPSLALLALLLAAGCAMAPPLERSLASVAVVAQDLLASLDARTDRRKIRLLVWEIHRTSAQDSRLGRVLPFRGERPDDVGALLEHEVTVYLTNHLNVVEAEHTRDDLLGSGEPHDLQEAALRYGANAVLAGDYVQVGEELHLSLRIVDVETMLLLAAARGVLPARPLGEL